MNEYPLHLNVLENNIDGLKKQLSKVSKNEVDQKDLRGKTPLELAVFLNHFKCAKILAEFGADCGVITKSGWNLVQESVSSRNAELIKLMISYRDYQRETARTNGIPEILNKLKQAPDFYVEMKWEFTSWIPLISKACPSDVYKIYKSGSNVRIDTTLIGFNGTSWERGNRSYIFQADNNGTATIIEIDHILKTYHLDKLTTIDPSEIAASSSAEIYYEPDVTVVQNKMISPNIVTFLDIEKIEFERNRSGVWGWRSDKNESINGYDCKVYSANNLQLVTKTRTEHLNKERAKAFMNELEVNESSNYNKQQNPNIPSFLTNFFQGNEHHIKIEKSEKKLSSLEYFQKQVFMDYYLNGMVRKIDETRKIQTFNANLSLSDSYPLSLHEQVLPIVDLMALNNSHFKKLKEFITLQLPSGFPVKIEIPLYRVITAKVTFGNIHALDQHVDDVATVKNTTHLSNSELTDSTNFMNFTSTSDTNELLDEDDSDSSRDSLIKSSASMCIVNECVFKIPANYRCTNRDYSSVQAGFMNDRNQNKASTAASYSNTRIIHHQQQPVDDDDVLLQIAIQQSLAVKELNKNTDETVGEVNELGSVSTAIMPIRDSSGSTQSLQEYQERRNNLVNNQTEEDLLLQRALAESLMINGSVTSETTISSSPNEVDSCIRKAIELSQREEEDRKRTQEREEKELKEILALSLMEK